MPWVWGTTIKALYKSTSFIVDARLCSLSVACWPVWAPAAVEKTDPFPGRNRRPQPSCRFVRFSFAYLSSFHQLLFRFFMLSLGYSCICFASTDWVIGYHFLHLSSNRLERSSPKWPLICLVGCQTLLYLLGMWRRQLKSASVGYGFHI